MNVMTHVVSAAVRLLEGIFSAGCIGSFLVIVLSAIDDLETILHKAPLAPDNDNDEPDGIPAYN